MQKLAFGAVPSHRLYRLRLARYKAMAETIAEYVNERPTERSLDLLDVGPGSGRSLAFLERNASLTNSTSTGWITASGRSRPSITQPDGS